MITFVTIHHDIRYGMPMLGYLAVVGAGLDRLRGAQGADRGRSRFWRSAWSATRSRIDFGVGGEVKVALVHRLPETEQASRSDRRSTRPTDFLAGAPNRDGDVPGLLEALHREGVRTVTWSVRTERSFPTSHPRG